MFLWYLPTICNICELLPSLGRVAENNLFFISGPDLALEDSSTQGLCSWPHLLNVANCRIDWQNLPHLGLYLRPISRIYMCPPAVHWTTKYCPFLLSSVPTGENTAACLLDCSIHCCLLVKVRSEAVSYLLLLKDVGVSHTLELVSDEQVHVLQI